MAVRETDNNPVGTVSNQELARRLDHIDEMLHHNAQRDVETRAAVARIEKFIEEHRPALARGLALVDPGAKLREMLPGGKKKHAQN
jgi:hypothetical protein